MKLIYRELYTINNKKPVCIPTITTYYDNSDNTLPNLVKDLPIFDDDYNSTSLSFCDGFFKGLSEEALEKMKSIFKFGSILLSNSDYINKEIWKQFLFTSNVNLAPIKKNIKSYNISKDDNNTNSKSKNQNKVNRYYSSLNLCYNEEIPIIQHSLCREIEKNLLNNKSIDLLLKHKYKPTILNEFSNALSDITSTGRNNGEIVIEYEINTNNELELLYTFLDCIFSSEYSYSIKICDKCTSFYIATKTDSKYCPTCKEIINNERSKIFRDKEIYMWENRLNSLYYHHNYKSEEEREKNIQKYTASKSKARKKFKNDELGMKNWFIEQHRLKKEQSKKKKTTS